MFILEMRRQSPHSLRFMKLIVTSAFLAATTLGFVGCNKLQPVVEPPVYQAIAAKLTIAEKQVDSVVMWNTKTGDARLLNAASFADKSTGQQGNVIGWIPLQDLKQAFQELASQIQAAKSAATPASTPIKPKN